MSRITDTERGARIAYGMSVEALAAPPMLPELALSGELSAIWMQIQFAAVDQMEEFRMSREACA